MKENCKVNYWAVFLQASKHCRYLSIPEARLTVESAQFTCIVKEAATFQTISPTVGFSGVSKKALYFFP